MDISLPIPSAGPHCEPLKCGDGARVFLLLKPGLENKAADGSGALIATIVGHSLFCSNAGSGLWNYVFDIDPEEIADGQTVSAEHIQGACCIECAGEALLRKLKRSYSLATMSESFRVFGGDDGDEDEVVAGQYRLFRRHTGIVLRSMEVSVARIDSEDGPYPDAPGTLSVKPLATPVQTLGPMMEIGSGAVVDPATSTPMTARYEFSPPFLLEGGSAFGIGVLPEREGVFHGLEVHIHFSPEEQQ